MVFLPLHDRNKLKVIPFQRVTAGLIAVNVAVFLVQLATGADRSYEFIASFGFTPVELMGLPTPATLGPFELPAVATLFTYSFFHGDFMHLAGNMLFLWIFGDNVEDALGHVRFLLFYLVGGAAAALAEAAFGAAGDVPLIGASGAISACLGAYLLLYPKVRIWVLVLMRLPIPLPAYGVIAVWVITQIAFILTSEDMGVAWWAHLGGFAAGMALVWPLRHRRAPGADGGTA